MNLFLSGTPAVIGLSARLGAISNTVMLIIVAASTVLRPWQCTRSWILYFLSLAPCDCFWIWMQSSPFYCGETKKLHQSEPADKAGKWLDRIWTPVAQRRFMGDCWQQTGPSINWMLGSFQSPLPLRDSVNFHNNAARDICLLCPIFQLKRLRPKALYSLLPLGSPVVKGGIWARSSVIPGLCLVLCVSKATCIHSAHLYVITTWCQFYPSQGHLCVLGGGWGAVISMDCPSP